MFLTADVSYSFIAGADYYEAVFYAHPNSSSNIHLTVTMEKPAVDYPFSWLTDSAKMLFGASLATLMLVTLRYALIQNSKKTLCKPFSSRQSWPQTASSAAFGFAGGLAFSVSG